MKTLLCAVLPITFLAACASIESSTGNATGQNAVSPIMFCWKDRLQAEGSDLVCNWAGSAAAACKETFSSKLGKSAIASGPTDAKRCDNGQWLVQVATK